MNSPAFDLTGRVALVTGASRGLGLYMARALARAGADVAITSRSLASVEAVAPEFEALGRRVLPLELELLDLPQIEPAVERVLDCFGRLDVLVNNAGCNRRKPSLEVTPDDWETIVGTNLRGPFFLACAAARRAMLPAGYGRIVNIGSVTSVFGYGGLAPYCASRGGVKQLTMSLADEWGARGVTVNCLAPGWFHTQQTDALYRNQAWVDYLVDRIPVKRPGRPDDLDGAIVFLASEESRYVTGQTLLVDGGITTGATKVSL